MAGITPRRRYCGAAAWQMCIRDRRGCVLPSAAAAGGDAVTVTTIHRSKGLEYPVVFLAGCNERFRKAEESSDIAMDRELGFACKLRDNYTMLQHKTCLLYTSGRRHIAGPPRPAAAAARSRWSHPAVFRYRR